MRFPGHLYPILDMDLCQSRSVAPAGLLDLWASAGVTICQLRAKSLAKKDYRELALQLTDSHPRTGIIVNDHAEVLLEFPEQFAGLHLGQEDLASLGRDGEDQLARHSMRDRWCLGLSTHSLDQFEAATAGGWDYLAVGPCFHTASKREPEAVVTPETMQSIARKCESLARPPTLVLIGGIRADRVQGLVQLVQPIRPVLAAIEAFFEADKFREISRAIGTQLLTGNQGHNIPSR